jgi:hypothetical protein
MTAQSRSSASIALCAIVYACISAKDVLAFSTGGNAAVRASINGAPIASRREWTPGTEIELPNLEVLFDRISTASPLAKLVMEGNSVHGGFEAIDDDVNHPELKWKKMEDNKRKTVHRIDKADRYQNIKTPLLRFRSSIKGPCIGERFSNFIMDLDERKKWDDQVANVHEMYPIDDLDSVNAILGDEEKYGVCSRVGVGYTQTKQGIISPREQLILGGMQEYKNGATILWGTEMEEYHNHLLPEGQRHTRAKSHLFSATLVPTGSDSFDVEYLLQMDVGGGLPHFMTTPALTDAVKKLFDHAKTYFEGGEGSDLDLYLKSRQQEDAYSEIEILTSDNEDLLDAEIDLSEVHSHHHAMKDLESLLFTP